jgi:hypothetical protein
MYSIHFAHPADPRGSPGRYSSTWMFSISIKGNQSRRQGKNGATQEPAEGYGGDPILATILMPINILKHCEISQVKLSSSYHSFVAFQDFNGQEPIPASVEPA